jgi:DNA-binding response OmpR family regulator
MRIDEGLMKILIVDDEPEQILMSQKRLESRGFEVISAEDGERGLRKAEEINPDLVILDVMMPGMDGFELCRKLKALSEPPPVIIVTASGMSHLELRTKGVRAEACFRRPYDSVELVEKVNELLKEKGS